MRSCSVKCPSLIPRDLWGRPDRGVSQIRAGRPRRKWSKTSTSTDTYREVAFSTAFPGLAWSGRLAGKLKPPNSATRTRLQTRTAPLWIDLQNIAATLFTISIGHPAPSPALYREKWGTPSPSPLRGPLFRSERQHNVLFINCLHFCPIDK